MAQSKALSTNVLQYRALRLSARLAREFGDATVAARYDAWADALGKAIDATFWDATAGMYATFTMAEPTPARIAKYDLLGNALAVLSGIAPPERAKSIFDHYPYAPFGPSVAWPQAPGQFVYHNRAQWPFVTAYSVRAAIAAGQVAAVDQGLAALERSAALHLSNMENLEWLTGRSQFDDGPEINSRRQLWSVGAYYGAVVQDVFGWQACADGVRVAPYLTTTTRARFTTREAVLSGLTFAGRTVDIALILPPKAAAGGVYPVASITLNGAPVSGLVTADQLQAGRNRVEVRFGPAVASDSKVTMVPAIDPVSHVEPRAFMPWTPGISAARRGADASEIGRAHV
jgi:glycogen debranching enzyme